MSFQTIITQQIAALTERFNAIAKKAKKIDELPKQNVLDPESRIHVSRGGVSERIDLHQITEPIEKKLDRVSSVSDKSKIYIKNADGTQAMMDIDEPDYEFIYSGPKNGGSFESKKFDKLELSNSDSSLPSSFSVKNGIKKDKVFQDFAAYATYSGLGMNLMNGGVVLIGDSNSEGYNTVGVGRENWFNKVASNLQKNQGLNSGIGFTNFSDLERYGVIKTGNTSIVSAGPTSTAIKMTPNSTLEFDSATNLVEIWFNTTPASGKLEFYYNGILYRTMDLGSAGTLNNFPSIDSPSFPSTPTPSGVSGRYVIKCTTGNVVITALFTEVLFSEGKDTYFFLRHCVSAKSFADFSANNILATYGLGLERNSLFLLNLGTNSIYGGSVATTSAVFGTQLAVYLNTLKTSNTNVVYIMPPQAMETSYPVIYEPYINYYNKAVDVCKSLGIVMLDLNSIYKYITKANCYESDGLHYSAQGHAAIADYMIKSLASIDINSINLVQNSKGTGTVNHLLKRNSVNNFEDSRISDDGSEILLNSTVRIPPATALIFGVPIVENFAQIYFNEKLKKLVYTNSIGNDTFSIDDASGKSKFHYPITIPNAVDGTDAVNLNQLNDRSPVFLSWGGRLNFNSVSAGTSSDLTLTMSGASIGDVVCVGVPIEAVRPNSNYTGFVSGANTVTVRLSNFGSASISISSEAFNIKIIK
ncbi:SGNH/GDSL hydrolase family protein [Flavobacterium sp. ALJ2]|uniref:SGNH/GDSL hydrolase family protein n=1 Tax=Flavobacterium sp. ALJ2 TaxID=2786960 RepID=UPI00189FCA0C|nr:SGNH/GDSL hydrolase family protein [Flavobacterium sp. ALJ2]MBF7090446.1 SGNH/GDSL hydrolase family protein [Flavobacterium sp. ALJ2]